MKLSLINQSVCSTNRKLAKEFRHSLWFFSIASLVLKHCSQCKFDIKDKQGLLCIDIIANFISYQFQLLIALVMIYVRLRRQSLHWLARTLVKCPSKTTPAAFEPVQLLLQPFIIFSHLLRIACT